MKKIPLTKGQFTLVDDEDFEWLNQWKWHVAYNNDNIRAYAVRALTQTRHIKMHNFIKNPPKGYEIDHKDMDGLNNQRSNLRVCTRSQNLMNRFLKNNTSGYKGVTYRKEIKKYRARITYKHKLMTLGNFENKIEAAKMYDKIARKLYGGFARLNFPIENDTLIS